MKQHYIKQIFSFYKQAKRMPSYQEILDLTGLKSKNAVAKVVQGMIKVGLVEKDETGRIIPKRLLGETRILGTVEAGFPSPAEEELVDTVTLDDYLIKNKEATFILKVSGDSMIDAGIRPGDLVLVERNRAPFDGDIVIAEVDAQWTMKYYKKRGSNITLLAANKKYKPIVPKNELKIAAVVISLIRKYK